MTNIDASGARVIEIVIDPKTGEQYMRDRAAMDLDDPGTEIAGTRGPVPPPVIPLEDKIAALEQENAELKAALAKATTFAAFKTEVAKPKGTK